MPKICCFFEKLEEIKKKLNKIKKLMGETFQNLRAHGKSVVVERQKNIVIERSEDSIITRKQTIIREKILNDENTLSSSKKPHISNTAKANTNTSARATGHKEQIVNSKRTTTTTTTTTATPLNSSYLHNPTKPFSALELAALKQDIDDEITNLKLQRNTLLKQAISTARENAKMREKKPVKTQIQNDMTWDQNFSTPKAETIELQFEKFSSEHNVQSTVRHKRDEQTSCRPRMRTIGLQKNTQRSADAKPNNLPIHDSLLNLKYNSTCDAIPTAFACFDYGPNCAANDFYRNPSNSHSGCQNNCQRYNMTGQCNGVICNQNSYRQLGRTPCTEYNYCRDEYYYDYSNISSSQQRNQVQEAALPPHLCYCHGDCRPHNHRRKKRSHHYEHKKEKANGIDEYEEQLLTKKYLLQQITKQQRDLEREEARALALRAARLKLDKKEHKIEKWQEESAARIASLLTQGKMSSKKPASVDSDSDTEEQKYQLRKEKLKVTKKKSYKLKKASGHDDPGYYEDVTSDGTRREEYNVETKRTLEKMRIHAYKPSPKRDSQQLGKVSEEIGDKSLKKEKRYAEYITQYKQDPLTTKLEAHKNVQTSLVMTQQAHHSNHLESVADEVGLKPKTTDLKSTQTSSINSTPITKVFSDKRISAHDGNELWDGPNNASQFVSHKRLTKEEFAQTDKQTPKPAEHKRLSSVGTTQNKQQFGIKEDKATSPLGGSFLSRDDAYKKGSKKAMMIPADLSPLERLAREETFSQESHGQTIHEQLSMRDHLFRGEYFPQHDSAAYADKTIDEKLSMRDRITKVESFDAGTREITIEKEYSVRSFRDELSPEVIQEQTFLERVSTSDRIIIEDSPKSQRNADSFQKGSLEGSMQDNKSQRESLKQTFNKIIPIDSLAYLRSSRKTNQDSINQGFLLPESRIPVRQQRGSYAVESRTLSTQEERSPQEHLTREGSLTAESRKLSTQEERSLQERLTKEGSYNAGSPKPSSLEERSPREPLTREGSYTTGSRMLSTLEERSPREHFTREGSFTADSRKLSSLQERSPREPLTGEGNYTTERRKLSAQEDRSQRESLMREGSHITDNRELNTLQERSPRENSAREENYIAGSQRNSTKGERSLRESLTREGNYMAGSQMLNTVEERSPRKSLAGEGSYTAENRKLSTQEERSLRERLTKEGSYNAGSPKPSSLEERSPRAPLTREESHTVGTRMLSTLEERSPHEHLTREGSLTADSRRLSTLQERSPKESLTREESYTAESRKLSNQKEYSPRERLTREGSYTAESRKLSTKEEPSQREYLTTEGSHIADNRKLNTLQERSLRENSTRENNYIEGSRRNSTIRERSPRETLTREGSYIPGSRMPSTVEERSPWKPLAGEASYTAESRKLSNKDRSPREPLTREGSNISDSRKLSTLQERSSREPLMREGSYTAESRKLSTEEERSLREPLANYILSSRKLSTVEEHTPRENVAREGSNTAENRKLSNQEERIPLENFTREGNYISESRKRSTQKGHTPRETLTREGSYSANSRELSAPEQGTTREHLINERSFIQDSPRLSRQKERTPRENLTREGSYISDSRNRTPQEELTQREHFMKEGSYVSDHQKRSTQEEHTPREYLSREGSYISENRKRSTQEGHTPQEYLTREGSFTAESRKRSTQEERSPRERLARDESSFQGSQKQSFQEERTPREFLAGERSYIQDLPEEHPPLQRLSREESLVQDSRKNRSTQEERTPLERLSREESFQHESPKGNYLEKLSPQESVAKEERYIQDLPREERYIRDTQEERSQLQERLPREESYIPPRERFSREASFLQASQLMKDNLSPRKHMTKADSIIQQNQKPLITRRELLSREESNSLDSPKRNTQEERPTRERSSREASFVQGSRVMPESLSPRERIAREESINKQSRNEQPPQERLPRESLLTEESYIQERRKTQEERSPRERLSREASFLKGSQLMQDSLSPRKYSMRKESMLQESRNPSTQNERLPQEHLSRQESYSPVSPKRSTQEERTPQERLSRGPSFLQGVMQDSLSPRERLTREESSLPESSEGERWEQDEHLNQPEHKKILSSSLLSKEETFPRQIEEQTLERQLSPRENLTKEASFQRYNPLPREHLLKMESKIQDNQKRSTPRTPRENLTRQESNLQDNRKRSYQGQRSPRESLTREGNFLQDKRRQSSPEKRTPRESLTKEDSNLQDSRKRSTQDQRSPRLTIEESFVKGRREQNALDHKPLRKRFKESVHEKVIPQNRLANKQASQQRVQEPTLKTQLSPRDHVTREDSRRRSSQGPHSPRENSTNKDTFPQGGQQQNFPKQRTSQKPVENDIEETSPLENDHITTQEQQQIPTIQVTPAEEGSNFKDRRKQSSTVARSPRASLKSTLYQRTSQTLQANTSPRRRTTREESSFIASQILQSSLSPRRRSTSQESFAKSSRVIRDSLTSHKRLSNLPINVPSESRRSSYVVQDVSRRSTLHILDSQNIRDNQLQLSDIVRQSVPNIPQVLGQTNLNVSDGRRRSTRDSQSARLTKEDILYPYMTYSQDTRDPYEHRRSSVLPGSHIRKDRPPQPTKDNDNKVDENINRIPDKNVPTKDNETKVDENKQKKDEPSKSLDDDCEIPPIICPEIFHDTPYECDPCIEKPETPCIPVYDACQTLSVQDEIYYDQPPIMLRTPIQERTYHEREMIYTQREYDPCVSRCYDRIPELRFQDNYEHPTTTTTTASSQASCSDYRPYKGPPQQMLICVNPLEQQLQQEQQPMQLQTMSPNPMPQFIPGQQFETEEELLQRLDLEARLRCCDTIQQESMYYCDGDEIKYANYESTIEQNYTEDEECRCDGEMYNNVAFSHRSYEQTMQEYIERKPSNCTVTSAYATASSGVSCTYVCNKEEMDPPEYQPQRPNLPPHQNRVIPEYTGCPCMLATYLDMMGLIRDNETPKERDECVKRISFR